MTPDTIAQSRLRIKERLQNMGFSGIGEPYVNEPTAKGGGISLGWIILALAIVAILATLRGC
jgi:hypothetical protein